MAVDHIRYDLLAQEALRGVVRRVLTDAAKKGLPGDHHFFITFDTRADGVRLSQRMRTEHPQEMTIVLQHQFWDLVVTDDVFEVGLSFGGVPERLHIPFAAVKGFFDPSVQFGLQFEQVSDEAADGTAKPEGQAGAQPAKTDASAKKPAIEPAEIKRPGPAAVPTTPTPANAEAEDKDADKPSAGGEVVRLDRFRKK